MMASMTKRELFNILGIGRRHPFDQFFDEGDCVCRADKREGVFEIDDEELCHRIFSKFPCSIFGCKQEFDSLLEFEMHYNSAHRYFCSYCKKHLPSPHFLDLHISETHDSFFSVMAQKKPMYRCFVEECVAVFPTPQERRSHCIECHQFPHNFRYDGIRKKSKVKSKTKIVDTAVDMDWKTCETPSKPEFESEKYIPNVMELGEEVSDGSTCEDNIYVAKSHKHVGRKVCLKKFSFGRGQSIAMKAEKKSNNDNNFKLQVSEKEADTSSNSKVWETSELMNAVEEVIDNNCNTQT